MIKYLMFNRNLRTEVINSTLKFLNDTSLLILAEDAFKKGNFEYTFCADDYFSENLKPIVQALNQSVKDYQFELVKKYRGYAWDVVVTDVRAKKIHEANLSDKTLRDAYHEAFSSKGVQSTIMFHQNMDKRLTEKEYQEAVNGYKAFISIMEEELND